MKIPETFYTIRKNNYNYYCTLYHGTDNIWDKKYKSKRRAITKAKLLSKEFGYPFLKHFKYFAAQQEGWLMSHHIDELIEQGLPADSLVTWDKATEIAFKRFEEQG